MSSKNDYEGRPVLWVIGGAATVVGLVWFFLTGAMLQFLFIGAAIWVGSMVTRPPESKGKGKK